MRRFLLQMAGESGSGKSTLARAIGEATGAVVLDKDLIKAPLLSLLPDEDAGRMSFEVLFGLAESILEQDQSLVIDSPAFYPFILDRGHELASRFGTVYRLIECICDEEIQSQRLQSRPHLESQPSALAEVVMQRMRPGRTTLLEPHLIVETSQPPDVCLAKALEYIGCDES